MFFLCRELCYFTLFVRPFFVLNLLPTHPLAHRGNCFCCIRLSHRVNQGLCINGSLLNLGEDIFPFFFNDLATFFGCGGCLLSIKNLDILNAMVFSNPLHEALECLESVSYRRTIDVLDRIDNHLTKLYSGICGTINPLFQFYAKLLTECVNTRDLAEFILHPPINWP